MLLIPGKLYKIKNEPAYWWRLEYHRIIPYFLGFRHHKDNEIIGKTFLYVKNYYFNGTNQLNGHCEYTFLYKNSFFKTNKLFADDIDNA